MASRIVDKESSTTYLVTTSSIYGSGTVKMWSLHFTNHGNLYRFGGPNRSVMHGSSSSRKSRTSLRLPRDVGQCKLVTDMIDSPPALPMCTKVIFRSEALWDKGKTVNLAPECKDKRDGDSPPLNFSTNDPCNTKDGLLIYNELRLAINGNISTNIIAGSRLFLTDDDG